MVDDMMTNQLLVKKQVICVSFLSKGSDTHRNLVLAYLL